MVGWRVVDVCGLCVWLLLFSLWDRDGERDEKFLGVVEFLWIGEMKGCDCAVYIETMDDVWERERDGMEREADR